MAVAFLVGSTVSNIGGVSTIDSGAITIGSQTDKAIGVIIELVSPIPETISSVVWDPAGVAQALTAVAAASQSGNRYTRGYSLANPSAVTNGIVRATFSGTATGHLSMTVGVFTGAHQTTPATDFTPAAATGTAITTTVPNVTSSDMVLDHTSGGGTDLTIGANQTQIGTTAAPSDVCAGSYQSGADGGVMSWDMNISSAWQIGAMRIASSATNLSIGVGSIGEPVIGGSTF